jgi:hypothetical protein
VLPWNNGPPDVLLVMLYLDADDARPGQKLGISISSSVDTGEGCGADGVDVDATTGSIALTHRFNSKQTEM